MRKNSKYRAIKAHNIFTWSRTLKTISLLSIVVIGLSLIPVGILMDKDLMNMRNGQVIGRRIYSINELKNSDLEYFNKEIVFQNYIFYLWNLTNSEDYLNGDKPQFEEIGPFIFRDHNHRENITYNGDDTEVNYSTYDRFEYLQNLSYNNLNIENTLITNINPGYVTKLGTREDDVGLMKMLFPDMLRIMKQEAIPIIAERMAEQELEPTYYLPDPEDVFYSEWLRDRFPCIELIGISWEDIMWLFDMDPVADIDIDGRKDPEKWAGSLGYSRPDDLNTTTRDDDYMNTHEQDLATSQLCEALWDENRPYSLTYNPSDPGLATTEHWFKLAGIIPATSGERATSKSLIESEFTSEFDYFSSVLGIPDDVIIDDRIAPWIYRGFYETFPHDAPDIDKQIGDDGYGWMYNIALWTCEEYKGSLIVERPIKEWLFTAIDGIISMSKIEAERALARINFFNTADSYEEAYTSGLSEAEGGKYKRKLNNITLKTGKNNISETCQISALNGEQYINEWPQPEIIRGTDGYKFHPNIHTSDNLEILDINIMKRVMKFEYIGDNFLNGVTVYRYELDSSIWTPNPDYDQDNELINLTSIRAAPIFVSKPHFLDANPSFVDAVSGLSPNGFLHDHYIEVEPKSGTTANIKLRLQYNIEVGPTEHFYKDIYTGSGSTTFMPLLWFEKSNIPDFDNDTIPDAWEAFHTVDDINADPDGDGLINLNEFQNGTDPNDEDTDDDKINDYDDPNPISYLDMDSDGMPDDWEAFYGVDDPYADPDGDGKTNLEEFKAGTNPIIYNKPEGKEDDKENESPPLDPPFLIIFIIIGALTGIAGYALTSILMKRKNNTISRIPEKKGVKGIANKPYNTLAKTLSSAAMEKKEIKSIVSTPDTSMNKSIMSEKPPVEKKHPFFPPKKPKIRVYCASCNSSQAITRDQFESYSCEKCKNNLFNIGFFCKNCNKIYPISKKDFTDLKEPEKVLCFKCNKVAEIVNSEK